MQERKEWKALLPPQTPSIQINEPPWPLQPPLPPHPHNMVSLPSTKPKPPRPQSAPKKSPRRNPSRKESRIRTQVINHLRKVERYSQSQPRRSVRLYIKECNQGFPRERPFAGAILFGEEGYLWENKNGIRAPPIGYRIVVDPLGDSESSDEDEDDALSK